MKNKTMKKQRGATLIIALIMLTVLTMLGVSSIKTSTVSLKIASNDKAKYNAFQVAYSAIDEAILDIGTTTPGEQSTLYSYKVGVDGSGADILIDAEVTLTSGVIVSGIPGEPINRAFNSRQLIVTASSASSGKSSSKSSSSKQVQGILVPLPGI